MISVPNELESKINTAHSCGDRRALAQLYTKLADISEAAHDVDAACFFLTHAFVFALEEGTDEQYAIQERLRAYNREE